MLCDFCQSLASTRPGTARPHQPPPTSILVGQEHGRHPIAVPPSDLPNPRPRIVGNTDRREVEQATFVTEPQPGTQIEP